MSQDDFFKNFEYLPEISLLCVEDDEVMSELMTEILSPYVKELFVAKDGQEGLELYKEKKPDVIITDIKMPILDGLDMAKVIREDNKKIPIFVNSAFTDISLFQKAISIGISGYIVKPSNLEDILVQINDAAGGIVKEKRLTETELYARELLDAQPQIIVINDGTQLLDANKAFLDFFQHYESISDFCQKHECVCEMFEESNEGDFITLNAFNKEWISKVINTKETYKCRMRKKEKVYTFLIHIREVYLGNQNRNLLAFEDITDVYDAQKALQEKEKQLLIQSRSAAMGEMMSMIAHQWRQPLGAISMSINNILLDVELEELNQEELKKRSYGILNQISHLSQTIDDFRNFFKPSKEETAVKLQSVVEDTLALLSKTFESNDIKVTYLDKGSSPISAYSRQLLQVFLNICTNAQDILKESKVENKMISIITLKEDIFDVIKICNNGPQIKKEHVSKVFEPYFSTKEAKNGTGLGLYISKLIIERHMNGSIEVKNTKEGVCFIIKIQ